MFVAQEKVDNALAKSGLVRRKQLVRVNDVFMRAYKPNLLLPLFIVFALLLLFTLSW